VPDATIALDLATEGLEQSFLTPLTPDVGPSAQNLSFKIGSRLHPLL